jgi:hypothetical protein
MQTKNLVPIRKIDDELQVVYGEVYAPGVPDSQGDFTSPQEVRKMAQRFMAMQRLSKIDEGHDNAETGAYVVESFIARTDDPVYLPEAWVIGVHVPSATVWKKVKSGELNGFSLEALVRAVMKDVEVEVPDLLSGTTSKDELEDHDHQFSVQFGDGGEFVGGRTTMTHGHFHEIRRATVTEPAADGHTHRYSFMEQVKIVSVS